MNYFIGYLYAKIRQNYKTIVTYDSNLYIYTKIPKKFDLTFIIKIIIVVIGKQDLNFIEILANITKLQ